MDLVGVTVSRSPLVALKTVNLEAESARVQTNRSSGSTYFVRGARTARMIELATSLGGSCSQ